MCHFSPGAAQPHQHGTVLELIQLLDSIWLKSSYLTGQAKGRHICLKPVVWLILRMDVPLKENYEVKEKREEGGVIFTLL